MKKALLTILFVFMLLCSAFGLFLMLPLAKEGTSWSNMPIFLGVVAGGLVLALVWWLAVGRSLKLALLGWIVVLPPIFAHGSTAISLVLARMEGQRLTETVRIAHYAESPITWPGFDGPVGLEIKLELAHASGIDAAILPPELRMGPELDVPGDRLSATRTSGSGYFKDTYLDHKVGDLTLLKVVLFQKVFVNPAAAKPIYKWNAYARFDASDTTLLTYHLLPGTVDYLPEPARICLDNRSSGVPLCAEGVKPASGCASRNITRVTEPIYAQGDDLSTIWMGVGANDMTADLSRQLTATLRRHSALQSNPAAWTAMQKRLEPAGLAKAGYDRCPAGDDSHTSFRICYCRGG